MAGSNKLTKTQFIATLADSSGLDKKAVNNVLDAMAELVRAQLGPDGPGEVTVPGLAKFKAKFVPATEDRPGIHPFTKEPTTIKGKPASRKVKATPLKNLKDLQG